MLSNSCRYGIMALIYIAGHPREEGMIGIKRISKDLNLPTPFLAKILQQLAKQKILSSSKGPHGGFALLKDPESITLLDIVMAIDGDDIFTNCIIHNGTCSSVLSEGKPCPVHGEFSVLRGNLLELFRSRTIGGLVRRESENENFFI